MTVLDSWSEHTAMLEQKSLMPLLPNCYHRGCLEKKINTEDNSRNRFVLPHATFAVEFLLKILLIDSFTYMFRSIV